MLSGIDNDRTSTRDHPLLRMSCVPDLAYISVLSPTRLGPDDGDAWHLPVGISSEHGSHDDVRVDVRTCS